MPDFPLPRAVLEARRHADVMDAVGYLADALDVIATRLNVELPERPPIGVFRADPDDAHADDDQQEEPNR